MKTAVRGGSQLRALAAAILCAFSCATAAWGGGIQPMVAVHDSELTRALGAMPLVNGPGGPGTTNKQWWTTDWHYFVMPESVKEALRSDGTAFTVIGDSNIMTGGLLTNDTPRYPIVISLASEAIHDDEISALTNYVAKGGFLLMGSSAFTRTPSGASRGDFAFADALGLHTVRSGLTNWGSNNTLTKTGPANHTLVSHLPAGALTNRMPSSAEEISWGISPSHPFLAPHDVWQVEASGATVLAAGDKYPLLCVKPYGKGYFIYHAAFQPLMGHGGFAPSMYAYVIFRRAIEWAFESANLPLPRVSPWPYPYDAAFMVRHDMENYSEHIKNIELSALTEFTNGARGDYYFCTGTVREDVSSTSRSNIIAGLRRSVTNYGATIGPHNGGLKNPNDPTLTKSQFQYWHWGPDEALDVTPTGYPSGKAYALTSISNSFIDVETWLSGTGNGGGFRPWVACYFNATRENSYDIQEDLGVKINGEQKLTPFPHWTLSTQTPGKRYSHLSQPVSDWYVGGAIAQSLEPWHWPGIHTSKTMHDVIDFYYELGGLINIYSHTLTLTNGGGGSAGTMVFDYVTYGMNTNLHPRMWSANAVDVYRWWVQRSNVQTSVQFTTSGGQSTISVSIARSVSTNTTIEIRIPETNSVCGFSVFANGSPAASDTYRTKGRVIKLRVGTTITNAAVTYCSSEAANTAPQLPAQDDRTLAESTTLLVSNAATDADVPAQGLSYQLIAPPAGASINADGLITWTPGESMGPGDYILTTVVMDNGAPPLGATNSFAVTVTEVNSAPILPAQDDAVIQKLTTLLITNTAADLDLPVNSLTYSLVDPPDGALINANGIITWTPTAAQGPATHAITTVVTDDGNPPLGTTNSFLVFVGGSNPASQQFFADDFSRSDPGLLPPWVSQSGKWSVADGQLQGGKNGPQTVTHVYLTDNWTNYTVQAQFSFPNGADGGGIGGYLTPTTGAHYGAWIYPENSPGGSRMLKLLKFRDWTSWGYNGSDSVAMREVTLPDVGTAWHTLTLGISNRLVTVAYDASQLISVMDTEPTPYLNGGICVSMWTDTTKYFMSVDNVLVTSLADNSPVTNAPPPMIESITLTGTGLVMNWTTVSNRTYRVQFTDSLQDALWNDATPDVLATGPRATVTNAVGNSLQRFYRVLFVP